MKTNLILLGLCLATGATAQQAVEKADVTIAFDLTGEGHRFAPTWGLDQAWISEQNMRKGINHMGKENIGIGRSCFRNTSALTNDSILANEQTQKLRQRANMFNLVSSTLPLVLTADQEAGVDEYFVKNKSCNVDHWAAGINSHVHWMQQNTKHPVIGVSIYNEPDYWTTEEGATVAKQTQVARLLRENYPRMDTIALVGANTLNDDKALTWYTSGKSWFEWANTHQLAGSFDNFAKFFQTVTADGKVGYADEMHNVGEAMIALEYGATIGIWWGFDSRARGEFCDISRHGERLAYGEHRTNWTAASVYRHDDGRVKAFLGSSERQAATTSYQFVSLDREVYFDGHGPLRQYRMEMPGGTVGSYQNGQTNAERVIDIEWGDDVPPTAITEGTYMLVNRGSGNVAAVAGTNVVMQRYKGTKTQQWIVGPCQARCGGDYSFYDFASANNGKTRMDVENYSCVTNANVIAYTPSGNPTSNQQWYLQYAGDGWYYVRNRESALYLSAYSSNTTNGVNVVQRTLQTDSTLHACQLWRLLPTEVDYDTEAPAQPEGLTAQPHPTAITLSWQQGAEDDLDGYLVLRADQATGVWTTEWNTIARRVSSPYVDNTVLPGHTYIYKVKAIDRSLNASVASEQVVATASDEHGLTARWLFDGSLRDASGNARHAATAADAEYVDTDAQQGPSALKVGGSQYVQLPPLPDFTDEGFTIALWVQRNSLRAWQRVFDLGYDTDHYIFLTPTNGTRMRLAIKAGDSEQTLDCASSTLPVKTWKHLVVTMKKGEAVIYVNGEQVASSEAITISPADVKPIVNYLGRSQFNADPIFDGLLDDVRLYNYALSASEVAGLYTEATGIEPTTAGEANADGPAYSLDGKRLPQPQHGLNIINGKVVRR